MKSSELYAFDRVRFAFNGITIATQSLFIQLLLAWRRAEEMKKKTLLLILFVIFTMILSACNFPTAKENSNNNQDLVKTAAAMTVEALLQATTPVPVVNEIPTATLAVAEATKPSLVVTETPKATLEPSATSLPCDAIKFVKDVTIEDGTSMKPGETFTKTWRLKNEGSCTWTTSYAVVFDGGDSMGGPASQSLSKSVAPGEEIDISVNLTAPTTPKTYRGNWKLRNASGVIFGLEGSKNSPFYVEIKVPEPTSQPFAVIGAVASVDNANFSGACPHTFNFSSTIKVNGAGKVTYWWERSDGAKSSEQTVEFSSAGEKTVTTTWQLSANYAGWVRLYINIPNHQSFNKVDFNLTCN